MVAEIVKDKQIARGVSFDINPSSRQILTDLVNEGHIASLLSAGARLHQAGCNGCIGMGQAPATGRNSLRTTPRNFPGRSGTREDSVFLCSPETAAASALKGEITDPRTLEEKYPKIKEPRHPSQDAGLQEPIPIEEAREVELHKGPNIASIPEMDPMPDELVLPVLLKMGDNISTDEILAGGARVLPYRSNLPEISKFTFEIVDDTYYNRAKGVKPQGGHMIIGGFNYGQGSSREHAALAPRYLGMRVALVKDFARIHWQNLVNFGILPLTFVHEEDHNNIEQGDVIRFSNIIDSLKNNKPLYGVIEGQNKKIEVKHALSPRQIEIILKGGLINWVKERAKVKMKEVTT